MKPELTKTTIRLPKPLLNQLKARALMKGLNFSQALAEALQQYLLRPINPKKRKIKFLSKDLGVKLTKITREDIYGDIDPSHFG